MATAVSTVIEMRCTHCGARLFPSSDRCASCDAHAGYPNVWAAEIPEQKKALLNRHKNAEVSTLARGCKKQFDDFGIATKESKAVLCVGLHLLAALKTPKNLLQNFYKQLAGGMRIVDSDDKWEITRNKIDPILFLGYNEKILFSALSLTEEGVAFFGQCHLTLKTELISNRATVFEKNSCLFYDEHDCKKSVPLGYRALWEDRHILAQAKLHSEINANTEATDFSTILISNANKETADFIEVHLYGAINIGTVESIKVVPSKNKFDAAMLEILKEQFVSFGVKVS